jgi:hypothetical protein
MTDRKTFHSNITKPDKFLKWHIFVEDNEAVYQVDDEIKITSDYNIYSDTIKYTVTTPFIMAQIQELIFSFSRDKLFKILNSEKGIKND